MYRERAIHICISYICAWKPRSRGQVFKLAKQLATINMVDDFNIKDLRAGVTISSTTYASNYRKQTVTAPLKRVVSGLFQVNL